MNNTDSVLLLHGIKEKKYLKFEDYLRAEFDYTHIVGSNISTQVSYLIIGGIPLWFNILKHQLYITDKGIIVFEKNLWKSPATLSFKNDALVCVHVKKSALDWHIDIVEKSGVVTTYPVRNHGSVEYLLRQIENIRKINPSVKFCGEYVEKYCRQNGITVPDDWKNAYSDFISSKSQKGNKEEDVFEIAGNKF